MAIEYCVHPKLFIAAIDVTRFDFQTGFYLD